VLSVFLEELARTKELMKAPPLHERLGEQVKVGVVVETEEAVLDQVDPTEGQSMVVEGASGRLECAPDELPATPSPERGRLIVQVCGEIVCFLCRSFPKALVKILSYKWQSQALLSLLPEWISTAAGSFPHQVLDLFRIQPVNKIETLDEDCIDYFIDDLLPFLSQKVHEKCGKPASEKDLKFIDFCIELYLLFFSFSVPRLNQAMLRLNFLAEVAATHSANCPKSRILRYLKLVKEHIRHCESPEQTSFDLEGLLRGYVDQFLVCGGHRNNILKALVLGILKTIADSPNRQLSAIILKIVSQKSPKELADRDYQEMLEEIRTSDASQNRRGKSGEAIVGAVSDKIAGRQETDGYNGLREWIAEVPSEIAGTFEAGSNLTLGNPDRHENKRCPSTKRDGSKSPLVPSSGKGAGPRAGGRGPTDCPPPDGLLNRRDFLDGA
jgi:hypothetical protein